MPGCMKTGMSPAAISTLMRMPAISSPSSCEMARVASFASRNLHSRPPALHHCAAALLGHCCCMLEEASRVLRSKNTGVKHH